MIDLRCPGTMHARIDLEAKIIEFKCKRRGCGAAPGVVVLHTFALDSGRLLSTRQFRDPSQRKEDRNGPVQPVAAIRAS